jgi:hypothetical protein
VTGPSGLLLDIALSCAVLLLVGTAGASLTRKAWAQNPRLGVAFGLIAVGVSGLLCFFAFLASPGAGAVVGRGVAVTATAVTAWAVWSHRLLLARTWRGLVAPALLVAGVVLCVVSLFTLWQPDDLSWFQLARVRFSHDLPTDNQIPSYLAVRMLEGGDLTTAPGGDWHSSDRPPLQTGLLLLVQAAAGWAGSGPANLDFATGVAAQALWVVPGYALLRALGATQRTSVLAVLFAGASGTVLVNTVFTWPKLLSAAFVLAALAVLVDLRRTRSAAASLMTAGALATLGMLSHGAAVFAMPVLAWALYRVRRSVSLRAVAGAALVSFLTYLPWVLYQRLGDPPGDRLLKWHLAGVTEPTDRSFSETLVHAYTDVSLRTLLEYKLTNLAAPFGKWPLAGVWDVGTDPYDRRVAEFFVLTPAIGLGTVAVAYLAVRALRALRRPDRGGGFTRTSAGLLLAVAGSLLLWCLALYLPHATSIHQGSHVPVLLLLLLPFAELARTRPAWAAVLLTLQCALLLVTYVPDTTSSGPASAFSVGMGLAGAAMAGAAIVAARTDERPAPTSTAAAEQATRRLPSWTVDGPRVAQRRLPPVPATVARSSTAPSATPRTGSYSVATRPGAMVDLPQRGLSRQSG